MISMAITHPAHRAEERCASAKSQMWLNGLLSLPPKLLIISAAVLAMGLGGCARDPAYRELNPVQRDVKAAPVQRKVKATSVRSPSRGNTNAETFQHPALRVRTPDAALLVPQPAPNCEIGKTDLKAVDTDEWSRLKAEYERQCYQDAEKAARERLSQLQASSTCEIEHPPQRQRPIR
jgi:hypothetical protein